MNSRYNTIILFTWDYFDICTHINSTKRKAHD